jgi:hypothetical protein
MFRVCDCVSDAACGFVFAVNDEERDARLGKLWLVPELQPRYGSWRVNPNPTTIRTSIMTKIDHDTACCNVSAAAVFKTEPTRALSIKNKFEGVAKFDVGGTSF